MGFSWGKLYCFIRAIVMYVCGNDSDDVDEHVLRLLYSLRFLGSDAHQVEIIDA